MAEAQSPVKPEEQKPEEQKPEGQSSEAKESETKESFVDSLFDTLTERAAKALILAGRGLAASAKWLESQAKVVADLAAKLEKPESTPNTVQP